METINVWGETIVAIMTALWGEIAGFLPNLLGAVLLLVIGYFVAKTVRFVVSKALDRAGFDDLSTKVGVTATLEKANIKLSASDIVGKICFWIIILVFLITATETLGLPRISETLDELLLYLPKVIAAALVVIIGLFVAHFMRDLVRSGAEGVGIQYARALGSTVYGVLFVVIISLAVSELEINTDLLNWVVSILLAAVGIAVALSLGLGTRDLARNILAGVYARDLYSAGSTIELEGIEGVLEQIGTVKTQIKLKDDRVVSVANNVMIDQRVTVKNN